MAGFKGQSPFQNRPSSSLFGCGSAALCLSADNKIIYFLSAALRGKIFFFLWINYLII